MRDLLRPMLPMILVLLVPIVPFVLFGERMEQWFEAWREGRPSELIVSGVVVGLLATDIFLPVPSSVVCTLAGSELGVWLGTLTSWLGMSLGALGGFALARKFGQSLVAWFTRPSDLARTAKLLERFGPAVLVIGRGVPVLAEASVLILGMHGMEWRKFLPPVLLSNLGLAVAYAAFGKWSQTHGGLPIALAFSIGLPVTLAVLFRLWAGNPSSDPPAQSDD